MVLEKYEARLLKEKEEKQNAKKRKKSTKNDKKC